MRPKRPTELTFEDLDEGGYIICGSPATVRDKLRVFSDELKAGLAPSSLPFCRISTYVKHREHDDHIALNSEVHGVREAPHQRSADS